MTTKTPAPLLDTDADAKVFRSVDMDSRSDMVRQIGRMNIFAISGGRVEAIAHGISLPVSNGYSVTVSLAGNDTYVVRRVRTAKPRGELIPVTRVYGERTEVYCDDLSEVCYMASCFRSYDAGEWPHKA